jgi:hypothetical protein
MRTKIIAAIALTFATHPILGAGMDECPENNICFYPQSGFKKLKRPAKSVINNTIETVELYDNPECVPDKQILLEPETRSPELFVTIQAFKCTIRKK